MESTLNLIPVSARYVADVFQNCLSSQDQVSLYNLDSRAQLLSAIQQYRLEHPYRSKSSNSSGYNSSSSNQSSSSSNTNSNSTFDEETLIVLGIQQKFHILVRNEARVPVI